MTSLVQFVFILLVPLLVVGGGLLTLFAVAALFDALENPDDMRRRVESLFRRPLQAPKDTAPDHYYRPHWKSEPPPPTRAA